MPEPPEIPDYTYGIELELIFPRDNNDSTGRRALATALTAGGIVCQAEDYNHLTRPHWKIVTDVSIGHENGELVSPILRGQDGFAAIRLACRIANEFGCTVNRNTGMHVHVGMRDHFNNRVGVFKELIRTYHRFETVLDQLTAPSRRGPSGGNGYCSSVRWLPEMETAGNVDELRNPIRNDRGKLNFAMAYWRHGTVEFRHHQGTTNAEKAIHWVTLCLRMVAHAAKNTEVSRAGSSPPARLDPSLPRDLARGTPLRPADIPRFNQDWAMRDMVISAAPHNPHRPGTRNHDEYEACRLALGRRDLNYYARLTNARRSYLTWQMGLGGVTVVRWSLCPILADPEAVVEEPTTATPVIVRPATDTTPITLEGLFTLLEMAPTERNYFIERHMELNS